MPTPDTLQMIEDIDKAGKEPAKMTTYGLITGGAGRSNVTAPNLGIGHIDIKESTDPKAATDQEATEVEVTEVREMVAANFS